MPIKELITEMLFAVDSNIQYLKEKGSTQFTLKSGEHVGGTGDAHLYEFPLTFLQEVEVDVDIELRIKELAVNGRISAVSDDYVQLELEKFIGETIPDARLIISNYYLMQKLSEKLKAIDEGKVKQTDLAAKTFREIAAGFHENYNLSDDFSSLNESQLAAVKKTLSNEVSYIWGPPGTGNDLPPKFDPNLS